MAGRESGKVNASVLILHHISPRFDGIDPITGLTNHTKLIEDATAASSNKSTTFIAYDFMELVVPWKGFAKEEEGEGVVSEKTRSNNNDDEDDDDDNEDEKNIKKDENSSLADTSEAVRKWFSQKRK